MASVRASLRQRAFLPGSTADIISDVNHQLVADVEDTGQFMTMFFMILDIESRHIDRVRAGHDPAILYTLDSDRWRSSEDRGSRSGSMAVGTSMPLKKRVFPVI